MPPGKANYLDAISSFQSGGRSSLGTDSQLIAKESNSFGAYKLQADLGWTERGTHRLVGLVAGPGNQFTLRPSRRNALGIRVATMVNVAASAFGLSAVLLFLFIRIQRCEICWRRLSDLPWRKDS